MDMSSISYDSIVDTDSKFALAFEMAGKVFTAFPIGRSSAAHNAIIGPSFYREIDKNNHGWGMRCHCGVLPFCAC